MGAESSPKIVIVDESPIRAFAGPAFDAADIGGYLDSFAVPRRTP